MAIIKALPAMHIIDGFKGKLDFYVCRGIPCVRKWPKKITSERSPAVQSSWPLFTEASKLWNTLSDAVRESYNSMASGTGLTGRDMFMRSYLSGWKDFETPPGDLL